MEDRRRAALTSPRGLCAHPPGWVGLGAEARAPEIRPQGEDWGWLREHSLKGASAPQLAGRESRKRSGPAEEARDIVSECARRGDSEHCLNDHQRRARAVAISADPRDGHETLRLMLQPPRSLCASTGHCPHLPSREPVQPATARILVIQGQLPRGNTQHTSGWYNVTLASAAAGSPRIPYPSLRPA